MAKRLVAFVLIALGLTSCASAPVLDPHKLTKEQWAFVCEETKAAGYDRVDCSKTKPPLLVVTELVGHLAGPGETWYGVHIPGEDTIFVNADHPEMWDQVGVHEAVHYLLVQTYGMRPMPGAVERCESEEVARRIESKYTGESYDDNWRFGYRCVRSEDLI